MLFITTALIFFFRIHTNFADISEDLGLLTFGFTKLQNNPTKITAYVCWNRKKIFNFSKLFSQNYHSLQIVNPKSEQLIYSLPEEHQFFVMDLLCNGSQEILKQVKFNIIYKCISIINFIYCRLMN